MYSFTCKGHENMLGKHANTIEFTKDKELTKRGDCIVGVDSDFSTASLKGFEGKIRVNIEVDGISDSFDAQVNSDFSSEHEMVFRRSDFSSERTYGIRSLKAAIDLRRDIIEKMKDPRKVMKVTIEKN